MTTETSLLTVPALPNGPAAKALVAELERRLAEGTHGGLSLAACKDGELVLQAAGGADPSGRPIETDSLLCMLSTTKVLGALVMHTLHDRGAFDYGDAVALHWPEFAANGKERITIEQVLSHRAGLTDPILGGYLAWKQWLEPGGVASLMEEMAPQWEPGTANGYHALSYGHVVDELCRRLTGASTGEFLRREIVEPLGIGDVYIGAPADVLPRHRGLGMSAADQAAATLGAAGDPDRAAHLRDAMQRFRFEMPPDANGHFFNSPTILGLSLPWGNGVATAGDMARLMNVYAFEGTYRGRTCFSKEIFDNAVTPRNGTEVEDKVVRSRARWGLGVLVGDTEGTMQTKGKLFGSSPGARTCGHLGGNCAVAWADPDERITFTLLTTNAPLGVTYEDLGDLVREAVA